MKKNKEIANIFNKIADVLEYKGENLFRVVAYRKSARIIEVIEYLKNNAPVINISPVGSLRRWKETIGDIDILVTVKDHKKIVDVFAHYPGVEKVFSARETKSFITKNQNLLHQQADALQEYYLG